MRRRLTLRFLLPILGVLPLLAACPPEDEEGGGADAGVTLSDAGQSTGASCTIDNECDDGLECTQDTCVVDQCFHTLLGDRDGDGYANRRLFGDSECSPGDICCDCDDGDSSRQSHVWFEETVTDEHGNEVVVDRERRCVAAP